MCRRARALMHMCFLSVLIQLNCFAFVIRVNTAAFLIEDTFFSFDYNEVTLQCKWSVTASRALLLFILDGFSSPQK